MGTKWHQINGTWVYFQIWSKCEIRGVGVMIGDKNPSGTSVMTLIFGSRLIWTQPADTFAVINSHIAAECFVPWNWIVLLSDKGRTMFVDACVNTHCKGDGIVLFPQNEIPPYESRITTAKLLIESEEYEVKCCVLCSCTGLLLVCVCCMCIMVGGLPGICMCPCMCLCAFLSSE